MIKKYYISQPYKKRGNLNYYGICKVGGKKLSEVSLGTTSKKIAEQWRTKQESSQFLPKQGGNDIIAKNIIDAIL